MIVQLSVMSLTSNMIQRHQDLIDMVPSTSSSVSSAMAESDIVGIHVDHLQVDLPITVVVLPTVAVMDITINHELNLSESKQHENNFCASNTSASLAKVIAGVDSCLNSKVLHQS